MTKILPKFGNYLSIWIDVHQGLPNVWRTDLLANCCWHEAWSCAMHMLQWLRQERGRGILFRSDGNKQLLLTGQSLADELAAVEDLQRKIDALLNQPRKLPGSKAE